MAIGVLNIGESGSGKSTSLRSVKSGFGIINTLGKPLPFKSDLKYVVTDDYAKVKDILKRSTSPSVVIDDAGYLMTNAFMRGHSMKTGKSGSYDFYNDMADQFWQLVEFVRTLDAKRIVYFFMHEEKSDTGTVTPKTLGKLLDSTVCVEGMFTIVLRSLYREGRHVFSTQTDGGDVAKSPIGMFAEQYIDNDITQVDKTIREFYGIQL
jgi:hypothetical protein